MNVGGIVQHLTGGPRMLVYQVSNQPNTTAALLHCRWWDGRTETFKDASFLPVELRLVVSE